MSYLQKKNALTFLTGYANGVADGKFNIQGNLKAEIEKGGTAFYYKLSNSGNFDFASDFLNRRDNGENFNFEGLEIGLRKPSEAQFYIDNYLNAQGMFSANAINWKETSFKLFMIVQDSR